MVGVNVLAQDVNAYKRFSNVRLFLPFFLIRIKHQTDTACYNKICNQICSQEARNIINQAASRPVESALLLRGQITPTCVLSLEFNLFMPQSCLVILHQWARYPAIGISGKYPELDQHLVQDM